jgi:hypothetical protein
MAPWMPPVTTLASGLELSAPIPCDRPTGSSPIAAISAVIMTGRILAPTSIFLSCLNFKKILRELM